MWSLRYGLTISNARGTIAEEVANIYTQANFRNLNDLSSVNKVLLACECYALFSPINNSTQAPRHISAANETINFYKQAAFNFYLL